MMVPGRRLLLLKTVSILLPFLFLFLLEAGLRIFHYGRNFDLFVEYPGDKDFYVMNPDASKRYFTDQQFATTGNTEPFKKHKDKNTLRLFVLGESTTLGYPYFHNGSFHRWLLYRLSRTFPDKNFEIINLSLTAVNSYTVYGFAKEVVNYEPDAVLIYTGHNEYYGVLGVASTERIGSNPALVNFILKLRGLKTVQLAGAFFSKIAGLFQKDRAAGGENRMEWMVANQQIRFGSDLYQKGIDQFRFNMDKTLEVLNKHKVPVFLSNLVSNVMDLKPFVSFAPDGRSSAGFRPNYEMGVKAYRRGDMGRADSCFLAADKVYGQHAACNYYLGKTALGRGDSLMASRYFDRARDLDGLRFRAPGMLDTVISQLSAKYGQVHLVDTRSAFALHSPHRIMGNRLILEHIHPNLLGYAVMSDAFYQALKGEKLIAASGAREMNFSQLLRDMPVTVTDSLTGFYKIAKLKNSWPFKGTMRADTFSVVSEEERLAYQLADRQVGWNEVADRSYDYYIGRADFKKARKVAAGLTLEYPTDAGYYEKAAMLSGKLEDDENAIFYFKKAFALLPSFDKARYLFVLYLQLDKPSEALPYLDYAIEHNSSRFNLMPVKAAAQRVIVLESALAKDPSNTVLMKGIADVYLKMDNKKAASKYLNRVLK